MLIFSWNVAGLSTTLKRIESDYAVTADHDDVTLASSSSTALARWLRRHHDPDVVCLQEHKIPLAVVSSSSSGGGLDLPDREAFWSCTVDPRRRGLDGVCTSCRRGRVVRADPRPLTDLPCGGAGRCLLTDHGAFVLFNVYAPAGSNPWGERRKFYEALRSAMRRKREEEGRRVVLVGDLNVAHGKRDVPWRSLLVDTDAVRNEVEEHRRRRGGGTKDGNGTEASASSDTKLPAWTSDLERCWTEITDALKTLETVPVTTTNPATGATFQRRRATVSFIRPDGVVRKIVLGKPEETTEDAVWPYTFEHDEFWCDDDDDNKEKKDNEKKTLIRKRNLVRIDVLSELVHKVGGTVWTIAQQREIARTHGDVNRDSPSRRWFENLIEDDGMVDVFRTLHPGVEGRFTCWSQQYNKRFTNEGVRLDYTLVDTSLISRTSSSSAPKLDPTEEAALAAATANGGFVGASYTGGGLAAPATRSALHAQFADTPCTGVSYTPPTYSDHVAVTLLLTNNDNDEQPLKLDEADAATKRAQPFRAQRSITSFFRARSNDGKDDAPPSLSKRRSATAATNETTSKRRKNTLHSFFKTK